MQVECYKPISLILSSDRFWRHTSDQIWSKDQRSGYGFVQSLSYCKTHSVWVLCLWAQTLQCESKAMKPRWPMMAKSNSRLRTSLLHTKKAGFVSLKQHRLLYASLLAPSGCHHVFSPCLLCGLKPNCSNVSRSRFVATKGWNQHVQLDSKTETKWRIHLTTGHANLGLFYLATSRISSKDAKPGYLGLL